MRTFFALITLIQLGEQCIALRFSLGFPIADLLKPSVCQS